MYNVANNIDAKQTTRFNPLIQFKSMVKERTMITFKNGSQGLHSPKSLSTWESKKSFIKPRKGGETISNLRYMRGNFICNRRTPDSSDLKNRVKI